MGVRRWRYVLVGGVLGRLLVSRELCKGHGRRTHTGNALGNRSGIELGVDGGIDATSEQ